MKEPTKRAGHRWWIVLQGYAVMACGIWIWITYDLQTLGGSLVVLGVGAHSWAREWVLSLAERLPWLEKWAGRMVGK